MQKKRILTALIAFSLLLASGTVGYRMIEGDTWSYFDGFFMTIITLATVGYGETHPLSQSGRVFTIFLLVTGAGLMAYTVTSIAQFIIEGKFKEFWGKLRMNERISALNGHYIICGAGNTGMVVVHELIEKKIDFVIIDSDEKVVEELHKQELLVVEGDATLDEVLLKAGLNKASGLVSALPQDANNVFVVLTAKGINPALFVVSTAAMTESVSKLKRAGADYVVSPNIIGGVRMASVIIRPSVVDFLDATMAGKDRALQMEEFKICQNSYLAGKALKDADLRRRSGAIIVSVKREEKNTINPEPTYVFEVGDILIVLGDHGQISRIGDLASSTK